MNRGKIKKLRDQLEALRSKGGISSGEMESFAGKCGRKKPTNRGKECVYDNIYLPGRPPLSIPHHSRDLPNGTAKSILNFLEQDLDEMLQNEEGGNDDA